MLSDLHYIQVWPHKISLIFYFLKTEEAALGERHLITPEPVLDIWRISYIAPTIWFQQSHR